MPTPHHPADLARRARLFAPGPRLGWVFRDRWQFLPEFTEPAPQAPEQSEQLHDAQDRAEDRHYWITKHTITLTVAAVVLDGLVVVAVALVGHGVTAAVATTAILVAAGLLVLAGAIITVSWRIQSRAAAAATRALHQTQQLHQLQLRLWHYRKAAHDHAAHAYIAGLPEWGAVHTGPAARRLDVFGGTKYTWEAFLTVYGTSVLADRPVIVVDLSRERVERELAATARAAGVPVDVQILPDHLAATTLLTGLSTEQLVHNLVESLHGGATGDTSTDRAQDARILNRLCGALGGDVSLGRIAAGLRALMNQPDTTDYLTPAERTHIADELFSSRYLDHAHEALRRIEAHIQPLENLGTARIDRDPGYLTCLTLAREGINARGDLLKDIIVQWLTHRITSDYTIAPAVIIAGADDIALRHLEHLAAVCAGSDGVHLTLLFKHLRGVATEFIGGGPVGFMRVNNHKEAKEAAEFIGRDHKFVLSQLTANLGGNHTHTLTETEGDSEAASISTSTATGWTKNWTKGTSTNRKRGTLFDPDRTLGGSKSTSTTDSDTTTGTEGWTHTRNWSISRAHAEGSNWTEGHTQQRVHEYTVEPESLQHLPDYAMLLVQSHPGRGRHLVPVEVDPAIITLPRVSTEPLPAELPPATPAPHVFPLNQPSPTAYLQSADNRVPAEPHTQPHATGNGLPNTQHAQVPAGEPHRPPQLAPTGPHCAHPGPCAGQPGCYWSRRPAH